MSGAGWISTLDGRPLTLDGRPPHALKASFASCAGPAVSHSEGVRTQWMACAE